MVLRRWNHVAGPGALKEISHFLRIPGLNGLRELSAEAGVRSITIGFAVMCRGRASLDLHRIGVPLGVGVELEPVLPSQRRRIAEQSGRWCPAGNRIRAPMDEYPEFRIAKPDGRDMIQD